MISSPYRQGLVSIPFREFDPLQLPRVRPLTVFKWFVSIPFREFDPLQRCRAATRNDVEVKFQSPSGNSILFNGARVHRQSPHSEVRFNPLPGIRSSSTRVERTRIHHPGGYVSIPFREFDPLQHGTLEVWMIDKFGFQSPSGNSILFNPPAPTQCVPTNLQVSIPFREFDPLQPARKASLQDVEAGFNPLPGIRSSSTRRRRPDHYRQLRVSIPFREFDPLQRTHARLLPERSDLVSIPFREFDPLQRVAVVRGSDMIRFVSIPFREFDPLQPTGDNMTTALGREFQSPSGNSILFNSGHSQGRGFEGWVSIPFREFDPLQPLRQSPR